MKRKRIFFPALLILLFSLVLSACGGFIPLNDEEPVSGEFGPDNTTQEQQSRTFESLWSHLQDTYIYFDTANVDWQAMHDSYTQRIGSGLSNDEFESLLADLEAELPPGSLSYQSRSERIEADLAALATYDGIGAFIGFEEQQAPHIVILSVIEESPAEKSGLKAHDSIYAIDGNPITTEEGLNAVSRIRGPAGTSVTLDVQSPGEGRREVEVERAKLSTTGKLESYRITNTNYAYLLFPPIGYEGLEQDVGKSLQTMAEAGQMDGLILDLRTSNSSRGWPLETLFSLFQKGPIGELYNRSQTQTVEVQPQDVFDSQTVPLVILVGKNTSGFPEVFAGSLQMYDRAKLIGESTTGDVETQSSFYLPDGARLFVESTSFRLPNGDEIGDQGVRPDIQVDARWDEVLPNRDPVLDRAIQFLETEK